MRLRSCAGIIKDRLGDWYVVRIVRPAIVLLLLAATSARAGWLMERVTRTENAPGPATRVTLTIAKGKIKELHEDGTYFLWDLPKGTLFQVDPGTRTYSGGAVTKMIADVRKYLDDMRQQLSRLTDEQREELARRSRGLPMPVPPPATPPRWTVTAKNQTTRIAGFRSRLFEIYGDGRLFEEVWISSEPALGDDVDYAAYARWSRELETSFTVGMGGSQPSGKAVEELDRKGVEMKSVLLGPNLRVVTEVTRLERRPVPDATFTLPPDYALKGTQVSATSGRGKLDVALLADDHQDRRLGLEILVGDAKHVVARDGVDERVVALGIIEAEPVVLDLREEAHHLAVRVEAEWKASGQIFLCRGELLVRHG